MSGWNICDLQDWRKAATAQKAHQNRSPRLRRTDVPDSDRPMSGTPILEGFQGVRSGRQKNEAVKPTLCHQHGTGLDRFTIIICL
ncbi:MAG: hypothetical protein K2H04_08815 [Bacteroidaceae bacterium]|nr:hypothetical protein [Bacteroidaceae bacterium]